MLSVPSESGEEAALASLLVSRLLRAGFDVDVDAAGNVVAAGATARRRSRWSGTRYRPGAYRGPPRRRPPAWTRRGRRQGSARHRDRRGEPAAARRWAAFRDRRRGRRGDPSTGRVFSRVDGRPVSAGHPRAERLGRRDHRLQGQPAPARERHQPHAHGAGRNRARPIGASRSFERCRICPQSERRRRRLRSCRRPRAPLRFESDGLSIGRASTSASERRPDAMSRRFSRLLDRPCLRRA